MSTTRCRCPRSKAWCACRATKSPQHLAQRQRLLSSTAATSTASSTWAIFVGMEAGAAARAGADAAGGAGARRRTFHRPRGRRADRQPRDRRQAGGSADRLDPRHLRRHHPRRRPHRRHPRHRRAGARRLARPRAGADGAARAARPPHRRAGGRRFDHRAPRDAAPARAQRHARAHRARRHGRDGGACRRHVPDIVLLDIEMPRMDGYEVATQHAQRCAPARRAHHHDHLARGREASRARHRARRR